MTQVTNNSQGPAMAAEPTSKPQGNHPLTPIENIFIGIVGGAVEVTVDQPLVRFKNELQKRKKGEKVFTRQMFSRQALYGGYSANAVGMAGVTAVQVAANEGIKNKISQNGQRQLSTVEKFASAFAAGSMSAFVACPSELVMDRHYDNVKDFKAEQEAEMKMGKTSASKPTPTYFNTMTKMVRSQGMPVFYRGIFQTMMRDGGFTAGYAAGAKYFKDKYMPYTNKEWMAAVAGGCTAGVLSAVVTHPFDTWKTRSQAGQTTQPWQGSVYKSVEFMYQGFTPRATRVVMAVSMLYGITVYMTDKMQERKDK